MSLPHLRARSSCTLDQYGLGPYAAICPWQCRVSLPIKALRLLPPLAARPPVERQAAGAVCNLRCRTVAIWPSFEGLENVEGEPCRRETTVLR